MKPEGHAEAEIGSRDLDQPFLVSGDTLVAHVVDQPVGICRQHGDHAARQDLLLELLEVELLLARAQRHQADLDALVEVERQIGRHRLDLGFPGRRGIGGQAFDAGIAAADDLGQVAVDVDLGQRQHAVTQGDLQARQFVEAERMHEQAKRRRIDEQREQHEQRGRECNELTGLLGQPVVAGRHHGQHDRDRAAQTAPDQDGLVAVVDRLNEVDLLQDGQHAEHDQGARHEGADRHGGHRQEVEPVDLQQDVGRQRRGQHEDQAARPEL